MAVHKQKKLPSRLFTGRKPPNIQPLHSSRRGETTDKSKDLHFRSLAKKYLETYQQGESPPPDQGEAGRLHPTGIEYLPGFESAATRLLEAVERRQKICAYGDFDCDGVCSTVILLDFLASAGAEKEQIRYFIPSRHIEDYGVTDAGLNACVGRHKPDLIVFLDCGNSSQAEISRLKAGHYGDRKIEAIVIDHHPCNPAANVSQECPHLNANSHEILPPPCQSLRYVCAAGMTFAFCCKLAEKQRLTGWNKQKALILAGLATQADVVPLHGINRLLVRYAAKLANQASFAETVPGLACLHELLIKQHNIGASAKKVTIDEETFGYLWGPCINAGGRLDSASPSVELLKESNNSSERSKAEEVLSLNQRRQSIQSAMLRTAEAMAYAQVEDREPAKVLLVCLPRWHIGVVGIIAGRLRDRFQRPAIVCGWTSDHVWRGSARSTEYFDLGSVLTEAKNVGLILSGGGHRLAAGLRFHENQRAKLHHWLCNHKSLPKETPTEVLKPLSQAYDLPAEKWLALYEELGPFGAGTPKPPLLVSRVRLVRLELVVWQKSGSFPTDQKQRKWGSIKHFDGHSTQLADEKPVPSPAALALDVLRKKTGFGLLVAVFQQENEHGDTRELHASWNNLTRGLREWRVGADYALLLEIKLNNKGEAAFRVKDSWGLV